jgi:PCFT/HCP family folate transporter-like MFS transporter 1/3
VRSDKSQDTGKFGPSVALLKQMTVEPIIFTHLTVLLMTHLCAEDLMLDRACRVNLNYDPFICDALKTRQIANYSTEEAAVQRVMSVIATWRSGLEYSLPCLIVLVLGAWSDRFGRRLPLLLPQIGTVLKIVGMLVCTYAEGLDSNLLAVVLSIPSTFTGGFPLFSAAYHSYIGDTSSKESRTARFGIASVFTTLGVSAGSAAGGFLLTKTTLGHSGVFQICGLMEVCLVVYTLVFIRSRKESSDSSAAPEAGGNIKVYFIVHVSYLEIDLFIGA